jgi:hypothetical protein
MALVHILRETGIEDDVEDSVLIKSEGVVDTDDEYTTWVEYRFPGSDLIVHRSAHVTLKKVLPELAAVVQQLA